jgi:RNA polymerase sigma-70 factor (ECF subfamily)
VGAAQIERAVKQRLPSFAVDLAPLFSDNLAAIAVRWPEAPRDGEGYAEHVAERVARQAAPEQALARLHVEDLFLAWWAGTGAAEGIAAFEAAYAAELARIAARFASLAADELLQQLRIKLFVGAPPKIHEYSGFGSLLAWLRVVAVRSFVDAARAARRHRYDEELDETELLGAPLASELRAGSGGAELVAAIKRAFADAVAGLAPRQRALLRHAYVDHLTLDQIAESYAIHRATVARILAGAREQLIEHTRGGVVAALGVAPGELASAIGTLDRRLDLSLSRVLRNT